MTREESGLTRFANSYIHRASRRDHLGRAAAARGRPDRQPHPRTRTDRDGLRALVAGAAAAAALLPPDPRWPGSPSRCRRPPPAQPARSTRPPPPPRRPTGPNVSARSWPRSAGARRRPGRVLPHRHSPPRSPNPPVSPRPAGTRRDLRRLARAAVAPTGWPPHVGRLADLDGAALGRRAAATPGPPWIRSIFRPYVRGVLEPEAVTDLRATRHARLQRKAYLERRSFAEPGTAQFDPSLTLVDAAVGRTRSACRTTPKAPAPPADLVRAGVTTRCVHDRAPPARRGPSRPGTPAGQRRGRPDAA